MFTWFFPLPLTLICSVFLVSSSAIISDLVCGVTILTEQLSGSYTSAKAAKESSSSARLPVCRPLKSWPVLSVQYYFRETPSLFFNSELYLDIAGNDVNSPVLQEGRSWLIACQHSLLNSSRTPLSNGRVSSPDYHNSHIFSLVTGTINFHRRQRKWKLKPGAKLIIRPHSIF